MSNGGPAGPYVTFPIGQSTACAPAPTFNATGWGRVNAINNTVACAAAPDMNAKTFTFIAGGTTGVPVAPRLHPDDVERIAQRVVELLLTKEIP